MGQHLVEHHASRRIVGRQWIHGPGIATASGTGAPGTRVRLATKRIRLDFDQAALALIAEKGFDPVYGARPLRRYLQREVETSLAKAMLAGEIPDGSLVCVRRAKDALGFEVKAGGFSD